jgi:hypothetical protein
MVFGTTFNKISVISWRSALLVEETGEPGENLSQVTDKLYHMQGALKNNCAERRETRKLLGYFV